MKGNSTFVKILVCLDGSSAAEQILPYVVDVALRFNSKVVLLQMIDISGAVYTPGQVVGRLHWRGRIEKEESETKAYLESLAVSLREKGLKVENVVLQGTGGETIVSYAHENEVDLIAITTHARRNLGRLVFGSVAETILRESGLPTLAIKPQHDSD